MKNTALLVFILSFLLVSCGDDSSSSVNDLSEEAEIFSSSSSKANKDFKPSSSSSVKSNKSSKSSSSSSENSELSSVSSSSSNEMELDNDSAKDGDIRWVTWQNPNGYGSGKYCEVYDDTTWRDGESNECGSDFGGCTKKRETKKIYHSDGYYICQNKAWMWVSVPIDSINPEMNIENESDTLGWKDTTEGAIRKGNITDVIYIFDNKQWRVATLPEASLGGCNEKTENIFGYVEMRIWQNFIPPTWFECKKNSDECPNATYSPGYYICQKKYDKKFYWSGLDISDHNHLCNNSSYYANSKEGDAHWGSIEPIKKKCINCKQENIDFLESTCKKRCYVLDGG